MVYKVLCVLSDLNCEESFQQVYIANERPDRRLGVCPSESLLSLPQPFWKLHGLLSRILYIKRTVMAKTDSSKLPHGYRIA